MSSLEVRGKKTENLWSNQVISHGGKSENSCEMYKNVHICDVLVTFIVC